ncbi:DUF1592 domain-containing protein [soil metagenome]
MIGRTSAVRYTVTAIAIATAFGMVRWRGAEPTAKPATDYPAIRGLVKQYCVSCHSTEAMKGSLDLERYATLDDVRKDIKPWQQMIELLEAGEMPPKGKPQPTDEQRKRLIDGIRGLLDTEARARSGDPGHVPLRRLSNAEYDTTIRDLTGVDLKPTREFPADGAAGEGFTNAAEALTDISPALLEKYLAAAKDVAEHVVLLPEGFRFSAGKTRREWSNECVAKLREYYSHYSEDGRLPFAPYLAATVKHHEAIVAGTITLDDVARKEKLNAKYLAALWATLTDKKPSMPLDLIRSHWRQATAKDIEGLVTEIKAWQTALWKFVRIGSYRHNNSVRQIANDPSDSVEQPRNPTTTSPDGSNHAKQLAGYAAFREAFPAYICFPAVIPTDEDVTLKMFHREDEPLTRFFLNSDDQKQLDQLWVELRFISQQYLAEEKHLPQFIEYATQDRTKEVVAFFNGLRVPFRKRAEEFEKEFDAAIPKQLESLLEFASRAYRRPLSTPEKDDLKKLYQALRSKNVPHEEAFRGVLAKVLVAPAFLFRIENAPAGTKTGPVNDWELATRLSYFLWSSTPDAELRTLAAAGTLHESKALGEQTQRMLKSDNVRPLAIEFGTQWLHVRGFDTFNEKNEKLFPTFDANLRKAINEESILFFQDIFQNDRPFQQLLDSDATFLNETLAKHYGIPGVTGLAWRRVEGVKKYGRGGILGLASVQAKQSGASRTSPVLRGNWVVETLLGEKLPRPPKDVPKLPEEEGGDKLTVRQQVERHAKDSACAVCHVRIDAFGFALEHYDAIGRRRDKDLGGLAVDAHAKLKDGTEFDGLDGLRTYLLTRKKDVFTRLFCRKLLGYALGREVTLSDTSLLDEMVKALNTKDAPISAAVTVIVNSPQFTTVRGAAVEHAK